MKITIPSIFVLDPLLKMINDSQGRSSRSLPHHPKADESDESDLVIGLPIQQFSDEDLEKVYEEVKSKL